MSLALQKSADHVKLVLSKKGVATIPPTELCLLLDVSGSYVPSYDNGNVQKLVTHLVPFGMAFDPDATVDVIPFSSGPAFHAEPLTLKNYEDYVRKEVMTAPNYDGGTEYAPAIEMALEIFGWMPTVKKAGFFGRLMGKQDETVYGSAKRRSIAILVTDGNNADHSETYRLLKDSDARKDGLYVLCVAVGGRASDYTFLNRIADDFGNVGFSHIPNLEKFVHADDEEVYSLLVQDELAEWLKK